MNASLVRPSWKSGFARSAAESAHPGLWEGLQGLWVPALGPTGLTLFDVSGRKNHGALTNMDPATDWVLGSPRTGGHALDHDGTDDVVSGAVSVPGLPITIAARLRSHDQTWRSLFGVTDDTESYGYYFYAGAAEDQVELLSKNAGGGNGCSAPGATENEWLSLAGVFDATGYITAYVDGRVVGTNGGPWGKDQAVTKFCLGLTPASANEFDGEIESFSVYDRALLASEVEQLHYEPNARLTLRRPVFPAAVAVLPPDEGHLYGGMIPLGGGLA